VTSGCIIPDAKVRGYLLNLGHPRGRSKAAFFMSQGFTAENWQALSAALTEHFQTGKHTFLEPDDYGQPIECVGPLSTPSGKTPLVTSGWKILSGEAIARFTTAYPT